MRLYYYTHFDYGLDDILNNHIKVSTLDSVNDPYEWIPYKSNVDADYARQFWHKLYGHRIGFVCLCEEANNPVMWSHYGDKHKGMVLGFDCDATCFRHVDYTEERVCLDGIENLDDEAMASKLNEFIYQKFEDWRYEKEYRCHVDLVEATKSKLVEAKLAYFLSIDNGLMHLQEIIVGCMAHERIGEVSNALVFGKWVCPGDTPKIKKAQLSSRYRMEIV